MQRLSDLVARNLGISRTAAVRMMAAGRVHDAQGIACTDRKTALTALAGPPSGSAGVLPQPPGVPTVLVDGEPIALYSTALVLLHKPVGVVTALRDNIHPTAYDLLRDAPLYPELRPAGRLDLDTSGLLLWTTEGALIQRLTHPKRRVPRTYQAALARPFAPLPPDLVLEDGHRPEVVELRVLPPAECHPGLIIPPETTQLATVTIIGGAYHEVRRLFAALGSHVLGLCRTRFGSYHLPSDLAPAAWLHLPDAPPGA